MNQQAWNALMANSLQVATINGVGDFILFLGKLAVGSICGLVSVLLLRGRQDIHFYIVPCIFIALFSFFIAHIILSLFEVRVKFIFTNTHTHTKSPQFGIFFIKNILVRIFCFFDRCLDGGRHIVFVCL